MSRTFKLAAAGGILIAAALVAWQGPGTVAAAFASVGWAGLLLIVLIRIAQVVGAGVSWWALIPNFSRFRPWTAVHLRFVREAINTLLPVAQVGGDIVGARLAMKFGVDGGSAGASVLIDLLTQTATQLVFALTGLGLLAALGGNETLILWVSAGLALMAAAVVGFFFFQRLGGFAVIERGLIRLAEKQGWSSLGKVASLHDRLQAIHADHRAMAASFIIHLVAWFVGALEIYVAVRLMGYGLDFGDAIVIESLGHAVRAAGFLIPGALGIQEGGFIALCAVYAIPAPAALALSFVKRVPEIVLGLPALVAWHRLEARGRGPEEVDATGPAGSSTAAAAPPQEFRTPLQ